ncbi:heavy metal-associated domain-containing protein [Sulfurimonas sp. HSL-1716]|uniref:heavy-metal-associated domain-containing protein n=1 Tax=Hydrocurvibacter sulfurireducens TaxID=3131937 RepID=UPI0031F86193
MLKTFEVGNIRCEGCANTIKKALGKEGFLSIEVDLSCEPRKVTTMITDEASLAHFKETLRNLGYPLFNEEIGYANSATLKVKSFVSCAVGKFNTKDDAN